MQGNAAYDLNHSEMVFPPNVTDAKTRVLVVDERRHPARNPKASANRRKTKAQRAARRANR